MSDRQQRTTIKAGCCPGTEIEYLKPSYGLMGQCGSINLVLGIEGYRKTCEGH